MRGTHNVTNPFSASACLRWITDEGMYAFNVTDIRVIDASTGGVWVFNHALWAHIAYRRFGAAAVYWVSAFTIRAHVHGAGDG